MVTLFLVTINGVTQCILPSDESCPNADDLAIYTASQRCCRMKLDINSASSVEEFSPIECLPLRINIPFTKHPKFFGLTFYKKLSWRSHLNAHKFRCRKSFDVL